MSADRREPNATPPNDPSDAADNALRKALFALEVPEPSPDFDARVLAAARGRFAWREVFLSYLRPALATASASAAVTLLLIHVTTKPAHPVIAAEEPLSAQAEMESADRIRHALEREQPTYIALDALRAGVPEVTH